eukprot:5005468-Amphidinium_carterae.1
MQAAPGKPRKYPARKADITVRRQVHLPLHTALHKAYDDAVSNCSTDISHRTGESSGAAAAGTVSRPYLRHSYSVGSYPYCPPHQGVTGSLLLDGAIAASKPKQIRHKSTESIVQRTDDILRSLVEDGPDWTRLQEKQAR